MPTSKTRVITALSLTRAGFAPFGDVVDASGTNHFPINGGMTERYHDLARVETSGDNARALISIARGQHYAFPLALRMVERHPLGSQAFVPLQQRPFLVVVCRDTPDGPGEPRAFVAGPDQGINYHRNVWHAVLTPIGEPQDFLIVDRGGDGNNLEEFFFAEPYEVRLPEEK